MRCKKHQHPMPCKTCLEDSLQYYLADNELRKQEGFKKEGRELPHDVDNIRKIISTLR